ncbi:MAG: transposase, OrfB family, central region, partial [Chthonomonadaceae bacterium]|nr:transposase, OrfB family, central region [Chthonomonadaceae bacterium]
AFRVRCCRCSGKVRTVGLRLPPQLSHRRQTENETRMIVTRCYRFRLEPNAEQEQEFFRFAGCRRFVWNWALERKKTVYKETGKGISYKALAAELVQLKKQPETAFLKECHSQVLQQTLMDLDKAFVSFFEKRAKFPKFKSRRRACHSFRIPQNVCLVDGKVSIPKIGLVNVRLHREMEGEIKGATIKQEPSGHWNVTFVSHLELPDAPPTCENPVGIDVGLESFVTLDSGEKAKPPRFYRKGERKLRRAQRKLSRCHKTSRNRAKAKKRVALCHAKVRNQRNDWLHKLSYQLVRLYDTLCIEDLNLKGLVRTKLAKSFSDAAISTFLRMLEYKVVPRYGQVVKVGRFFPSSKTCSNPDCGHKQPLELSDRMWVCERCGTLHDRDINAAINILVEGLRILAVGIPESRNANGGNVRLAKVSNSC